MTILIGLLGRSRTGKDTAAAIVSNVLGYPLRRLASPIKDACHVLFDIPRHSLEHSDKDVVDARYGHTPRDLMMWLTTTMQRDFPPDFFFSRLLDTIPPDAPGIVIPDVRYQHDVDNIRKRGGVVIQITRDHAPVRLVHERSIDALDGDVLLENNGTLDAFEKRVMEWVHEFRQMHTV